MSFGASGGDTFAVKKFETQEEVEKKKRLRQEQWDKVRKPDDPQECPEEETRSLFDQLQDNLESKQKDFEDEFKMRNSVKVLDEEESKFLDFVSHRQLQLEKEREKEEQFVLEEMKEAAVKRVQDKVSQVATEPKKSAALPLLSTSRKSQQSLLMGAIKRKSTDSTQGDSAKRKRSESESSAGSSNTVPVEDKGDKLLDLIDCSKPVAQVAGFLPGIGVYDNNSSSNSSSPESDIEDYISTRNYKIQQILDSISGSKLAVE